jgi:hypothetical protein
MILLDENIPEAQRQLLRGWRIHARQIGVDVADKGIKDQAIIPLLHEIGGVTFFTRDLGFFSRQLVHRSYCLVCLELGQYEVASFVRRFRHHPRFSTERKRDGSVVRVGHRGISRLALGNVDEILAWQLD